MNKIEKLFDEQFVLELFKKEVLPKYPDFLDIKKIEIQKHKKYIWDDTYHVVVEFITQFISKEDKNKITKLSIFCSAHSDEPRKNVYDVLEFLWENSFSEDLLTIPRPLFFSKEFNGTFYRGVVGRNLYQFIREKNFPEIEAIIPKAAKWFAKLHRLSTEGGRDFNIENSRLRTVIPGKDHILRDVENNFPEYLDFYEKAYKIFIKEEEEFLSSTKKRWYIHGDAHPENIIKMSERTLAVIDFTDLCLSDFARDLGCFMQQLEFMSNRKIGDKSYADKIKKLFLDNYLENAKITLDNDLKKRIDNYYNWTAIRTATYFLIKHDAEPERSAPLIEQVKKNLNI